jgi:hypothetical protein
MKYLAFLFSLACSNPAFANQEVLVLGSKIAGISPILFDDWLKENDENEMLAKSAISQFKIRHGQGTKSIWIGVGAYFIGSSIALIGWSYAGQNSSSSNWGLDDPALPIVVIGATTAFSGIYYFLPRGIYFKLAPSREERILRLQAGIQLKKW